MTTHTHAARSRANRGTTYRAPSPPPLTRRQLDELAVELQLEIARIERSLTAGESSAELDSARRALARIGEGTYGICLTCGNEMTFARLQVMPATQRCVRCAR